MQPAEKLAKLRQFCTDLFTRYRLSSKGRNGLTEAEDDDEIFFIKIKVMMGHQKSQSFYQLVDHDFIGVGWKTKPCRKC